MTKQSKDYHDYVFKNGSLLGEFDKMYQCSDQIPWHQDKTAFYIHSDICLYLIRLINPSSICEVGCGLGIFTNRIYSETPIKKIAGIDISETAIDQARKNNTKISYAVSDIRNSPHGNYEMVVFKEILWYVFQELYLVIQNASDMMTDEGYLLISQSFPDTETYIGSDVISSPEHLVKIFSEHFTLIYFLESREARFGLERCVNLLFQKKSCSK